MDAQALGLKPLSPFTPAVLEPGSPPPPSTPPHTHSSPPPCIFSPTLWQKSHFKLSLILPLPVNGGIPGFLAQVLCTQAQTPMCTHSAYVYSYMHRVANMEIVDFWLFFEKQVQQPWTCISPWQPCRSPCGGPQGH